MPGLIRPLTYRKAPLEGAAPAWVVRILTADRRHGSHNLGDAMATNGWGVLLVDDEADELTSTRRILESILEARVRVFTAANFEQAVVVFDKHRAEIRLAILDVALPGRNGVELAKHLLAEEPNLRVLFISGHVGASVIGFYGLDASDEQFLKKPFDRAALIQRVNAMLWSEQQVSSTSRRSSVTPKPQP